MGGDVQPETISIVPLIVAALIRIVVGSLWYSPIGFAATWRRLVNVTEAQFQAGMPKAIAADVVGSLLLAYGLAHVVAWAGAATIAQGFEVGFLCWLSFVAVILLTTVLYEQKPLRLFVLNAGFNLIALALMGALLAVWR
jgi:hypothetical protein